MEYLRSKKPPVTSEGQLRYYYSLYNRLPEVIVFSEIRGYCGGNKHCLSLVNHMANYLWQVGLLEAEDKLRVNEIVRNLRPVSYSRHSSDRIVDIHLVADSIKGISDASPVAARVRTVYKLLYYSGIRLVEACHILKHIDDYTQALEQNNVNDKGVVLLGDTVRLNIFWARGKKHLDHAWLPYSLYNSIKDRRRECSADSITTWARKHGLVRPSDVREAHYQYMQLLNPPGMVADAIQSRFREKSVSETHYSQTVILADSFYENKLYPSLKKILNEGRPP